MSLQQTEYLHAAAKGLDALPDADILCHLHDSQSQAVQAVAPVLTEIAAAAHLMAHTVRSGGRLIYTAAGSSGLMAMADALELPGTFGIEQSQIAILMAGGLPTDGTMPGHSEDDTAEADTFARTIKSCDLVIALSASGTTPHALQLARAATLAGAQTVCIANNRSAPLFDTASVAICLATPAEVVAGSTRLGAGTAQKVALNLMSTLMGVLLGHVHDGMMVNLIADNTKLRARAATIVKTITGASPEQAENTLSRTGGAIKPAVLLAAGAQTQEQAVALLKHSDGHLRPALTELRTPTNPIERL
ncbi:MAG: N-acetylmuramic acid 6-phosphate etherase [Rhodobacteraceae bacterium]|nr:N-acetylmuramic acid 6-phosphate etherase [Paracoccaceae bacterium]